MKIFKKQIPVRHILYVVLGWLHATMLCVPLYALVLNFVSEGMTKDVILQNILRGFLILAPIALSWFAIKCLRRIFFYILASIGITVLTGFLFDSVLMAVVALFICFMRLYGRLHGESHSLFDHAGYAGLAVFAVPFLCSVFTDRADLLFQPVSLVFAAVYFVLCLTQRGIRRIDDYIDVNAAMQNMPARRIVRITCALLAAAAVFCTAVLLPPLLTSDIGYRYTPREAIHAEYTLPEQTETSSGGDMPLDEMIPAAEPSPVLVLIMKILEYIVLIALAPQKNRPRAGCPPPKRKPTRSSKTMPCTSSTKKPGTAKKAVQKTTSPQYKLYKANSPWHTENRSHGLFYFIYFCTSGCSLRMYRTISPFIE